VQRSSDFLHWLAVSLSLRQARPLSLAQHPMEVLLVDQTSDEEKNQETLADISKCRQNARDKVSPASEFFTEVICFNPEPAFRHQGQSGIAGHGLVLHCLA
jgi:hypothetical protein